MRSAGSCHHQAAGHGEHPGVGSQDQYLLVVHEACGSFGVGAEIVARVTEEALTSLKAPPRRLTGVDAAVPYYRNEEYYLITEQDIADAAHQLMENQWL